MELSGEIRGFIYVKQSHSAGHLAGARTASCPCSPWAALPGACTRVRHAVKSPEGRGHHGEPEGAEHGPLSVPAEPQTAFLAEPLLPPCRLLLRRGFAVAPAPLRR